MPVTKENDGMVSFFNNNTKDMTRSTFTVSLNDRAGFYKTCAQTNANIVSVQSPSLSGYSHYTIQFHNKKEEKKFSKLLQRNTDGYFYSFLSTKYGLYLVSGLTYFAVGFLGCLVGKQIEESMHEEKQPTPQVQKITNQKQLPAQDTSRGARTE
ncbi:MAG: hypothetical protein IJ440_00585 [Alphaproteobacteria bacterium]|nr:hypothetical protein [Alphaproteobacteria bacterium]